METLTSNRTYFVPDLSDIYPGYQLEVQYYKQPWEAHTVGEPYGPHERGSFMEILPGLLNKGQVRVPYLDTQSFEAQGFVIESNGSVITGRRSTREGFWHFVYNSGRKLKLTFEGTNVFYGDCRCENTLRQVLKLVGYQP